MCRARDGAVHGRAERLVHVLEEAVVRPGDHETVAAVESLLAGVLIAVCWSMAEKAEFYRLLADWRSASVLLATFGLTLLKDLTTGIVVGCLLATVFAVIKRPIPEEGA